MCVTLSKVLKKNTCSKPVLQSLNSFVTPNITYCLCSLSFSILKMRIIAVLTPRAILRLKEIIHLKGSAQCLAQSRRSQTFVTVFTENTTLLTGLLNSFIRKGLGKATPSFLEKREFGNRAQVQRLWASAGALCESRPVNSDREGGRCLEPRTLPRSIYGPDIRVGPVVGTGVS